MPFNEKGEFIRLPSKAVQASRTQPQSAGTPTNTSFDKQELITIGKALAALALLVGSLWFLVVFREWIVIGLGLWLISKLRSLFS